MPLSSASPSLGPSATGATPAACRASAPDTRLALHHRLALADQHEAHVRERREIARGADRALARNDRQHVGIDEGGQRLHGGERDAGGALRQRIELHQQDQPRDARRQRRADARRMRAHDVDLQPVEILRRDARLGQLAEAGVDAIDRVARASSRFTVSAERRMRARALSDRST